LVLTALAFTLTASAYTVMAFKKRDAVAAASPRADSGLLEFLDRHGASLLGAELVALALAAIVAVVLDRRPAYPRGNTQDARPPEDPDSRDSGVP